jgi:hypothetical protein
VEGDHDPSAIFVFAGKERPDFIGGSAKPSRGKEILTTGAKSLCDNDIALLLLDRALVGGVIAPVRLDTKPVNGEMVTVVGWGIAEDDPNPPVRRQRANVEILDVGPADQLGPNEFRIGEGTCQGDSGGPAIAASGAVLGALSRGGNGTDGTGADSCLGGTNIFTSTAAHADFIRAGYEKAGQEPWLEGQPNPLLAKVGATCAADAECRSNVCDAERKVCADACDHAACAAGFTCAEHATRKVCVPSKPQDYDDGCAVGAPGSTASSYPLIAFAVAVLFACARRKK